MSRNLTYQTKDLNSPQNLLERGDRKASSEECFVSGELMRSEAVRALGLLGKECRNYQLCFPDTTKASFSPHIHS